MSKRKFKRNVKTIWSREKRFCWTIFSSLFMFWEVKFPAFCWLIKGLETQWGNDNGLAALKRCDGETFAECRSFRSVYPHGCLPWFCGGCLPFQNALTSKNQHGDSGAAKDVRDLGARYCPVFGSGHVSPLEDRVEPWTCHCGQYHDYGSRSLLSSLALRSKCRFGAWKFCCHHDGWDGYVPARRRDADPFKCQ